jgi:hypothetical protein
MGKPTILIGKSTNQLFLWAIFNSYVKLPEGITATSPLDFTRSTCGTTMPLKRRWDPSKEKPAKGYLGSAHANTSMVYYGLIWFNMV